MDLIVDGYNLIGSEQGLSGALEPKRNRLVQRLSAYRKIKQFNVTVVFDGWRSGGGRAAVQNKEGIAIIYSALDEKADAVIIRLARQKGAGTVVVSSDREIRSAAERFGAVAISAGQFSEILSGLDDRREHDDFTDDERSSHKGNPRRAAKADRRRKNKLRKLRF
jgi:predicted RNA-binding protein with PIN domain